MNIWFRTSNNRNRNGLTNSCASSFNTELPTITEHHRRNEDADEDESSRHSKSSSHHLHQDLRASQGYSKILQQDSSSILQNNRKNKIYHDDQSETDFEENQLSDINKTNKSVRFNLNKESIQQSNNFNRPKVERTNSIMRTNSTYYGGKNNEESEQGEPHTEDHTFLEFKHIKNNRDRPKQDENDRSENLTTQYRKESSKSRITPVPSHKNQSSSRSRTPIDINEQNASVSIIPKTGRSNNSLSVNYLFTEQRANQTWNLTKSIDKNSVIKTTGRKQNIKQHIISLIEYCSNQVGMAIYNTTNGEIFLCQIIERLTYFRTISTIERFYPLEIIYSSSLEHTPLMKKINEKFRATTLRNFRRMVFDETKGFQIYNQRGNKEENNPDNKFIAYSALNALIFYLENSLETKFSYSSLKIRWHLLEDLLIIESQTIFSLEIFLNAETKQKGNCFISNFQCFTYGGTRMLRANFLQPLSNDQMIKSRQDLVQIFLDDRLLYDCICQQIQKFKNFQIITAKFIQMPKQKNIKSLKSYLSAIYSISHTCLLLKNFHKKIESYTSKNLPVISKLFTLINDIKITQLKQNIQANFDEEMLKNYQHSNKAKKDNFIFLFKIERMEDDFIEVMRITYSHTMQDILRVFKVIKDKSGFDLKLLYNEFRGYYIKSNKKINLCELSEKVEDDIIQINQRKDCINFSTSMLVSLNNRLKQSEKKLILLSEGLLHSIIQDIQKNIDILFDINYEMSIIDMILSFVGFVKKYHMVTFCKPQILKNCNSFEVEGLKTVWTNESKYQISNQINVNMGENKKILIFQKQPNSFQQLNTLYSIGYLTILSQIGCFVPANSFKTDIYHTLLSKIHLSESIETNLSHFQMELYHFKNVMDNVLHKNTKCLILFDELIKGTQYQEEVSLSLALVNQLSKVSGKTFILISDIFQINVINKLESLKKSNPSSAKKPNTYPQNIFQEQSSEELVLNSIQIEKARSTNEIDNLMQDLNFSDQFINLFNRLSLRQQKQRLFR